MLGQLHAVLAQAPKDSGGTWLARRTREARLAQWCMSAWMREVMEARLRSAALMCDAPPSLDRRGRPNIDSLRACTLLYQEASCRAAVEGRDIVSDIKTHVIGCHLAIMHNLLRSEMQLSRSLHCTAHGMQGRWGDCSCFFVQGE